MRWAEREASVGEMSFSPHIICKDARGHRDTLVLCFITTTGEKYERNFTYILDDAWIAGYF
jgi:hypothetical protein